MTLCPGTAPRSGGESNCEGRRGRPDCGGRFRGSCLQFERDRCAHDSYSARIDSTVDDRRDDTRDDGRSDLDQHSCAHDVRLDLHEHNDPENDRTVDDHDDGAATLCGDHEWRPYTGLGSPEELTDFTETLVRSLTC